ncbi:MAG: ABC transporter permease [Bryobacteraceae bacterium]
MNASYGSVELAAAGRLLKARFRIGNRSGQDWKAEDGFRLGTQIIDPETHVYVEDGPRVVPGEVVARGGFAEVEVGVELPEPAGRYRIYVSPMREEAGWFYQQGWPFLVVDAVMEGGEAKPLGWRVTTARGLRAAILLRSLGRVFTYPVLSIWRNRSLIRSMVRRDILGRYRGSMGGLFWTVLNPLLLMLTYFFVFGVVLRTRFAGDPSRSGFVLYFLAGMLSWLPFSEAAGRAPMVMMEYRNFVKRLVFPLETLPVNLTAAGLVTQAFALAVFLVILVLVRGSVPLSALWLPALIVPQVLLTLGLCWFLAGLGVYVRDLGQINGFLLTLWFFLTPICYPEESLPAEAMGVLSKNPLLALVRGYRNVLLEGTAPDFGPMWKLWLVSGAVFFLGHAWFYKLRKTFVDVI